MAKNTAGSYHRTTIYLTDEQWRWLSRLVAQARLDDLQLCDARKRFLYILRAGQRAASGRPRPAARRRA